MQHKIRALSRLVDSLTELLFVAVFYCFSARVYSLVFVKEVHCSQYSSSRNLILKFGQSGVKIFFLYFSQFFRAELFCNCFHLQTYIGILVGKVAVVAARIRKNDIQILEVPVNGLNFEILCRLEVDITDTAQSYSTLVEKSARLAEVNAFSIVRSLCFGNLVNSTPVEKVIENFAYEHFETSRRRNSRSSEYVARGSSAKTAYLEPVLFKISAYALYQSGRIAVFLFVNIKIVEVDAYGSKSYRIYYDFIVRRRRYARDSVYRYRCAKHLSVVVVGMIAAYFYSSGRRKEYAVFAVFRAMHIVNLFISVSLISKLAFTVKSFDFCLKIFVVCQLGNKFLVCHNILL